MQLNYTYMEALGQAWPNVQAHCMGDGSVYEDITRVAGDPLPTKAELDAWIAADVKIDMWKLIQAERDRRKSAGLLIGTKWFHSDDTSRIQYLGLVLMGAGMPAGIMWKTMDGSFVEMTPTLAGQIFQAMGAKDIAIFTVAEQRKALMLASPNPATYNYLTGSPAWSTVFGE